MNRSRTPSRLARICLALGLALGILAAPQRGQAATEKVLYAFKPSAANPQAGLIKLGAKLYGTTQRGTIFAVTPAGKVHTVATLPDTPFNVTGLLAVGKLLYGMAIDGGDPTCQCGYVFSATETGEVTILHDFTGGRDGAVPSGSLIELDGVLYGATMSGGSKTNCKLTQFSGCGTVFGITPQGGYTQIYAFKGPNAGDGSGPSGPFTAVNGVLYGTTSYGGASQNQYSPGTLFSLSIQGVETVLHSFGLDKTDGYYPNPGLLLVGDTLYGTTYSGGTGFFGTAYSIGLDGSGEHIMHAFTSDATDGSSPGGGLIAVNGLFYGTTTMGTSANAGTVFSLTEQGDEATVYAFQGINKQLGTHDAAQPNAPLLSIDGTLYGTSSGGGRNSKVCSYDQTRAHSCGTIFEITP